MVGQSGVSLHFTVKRKSLEHTEKYQQYYWLAITPKNRRHRIGRLGKHQDVFQ